MITEVLKETIIRVIEIAAIVLPVLFLVEYLNHKFGDKLLHFFEKQKRFMPVWSAVLSILPGCNAAAAVATLYARGMVSVGSLISAMIATSDEAIYVFIPQGFNFLPLFVAKLVLAIFAGVMTDLILSNPKLKNTKKEIEIDYCCSIHHDHSHKIWGMVKHTAQHGIKIIGFIFLTLFLFNYFQDYFGAERLGGVISQTGNIQPFVTGLFGLLPGCGTSVILATLFSKGIITFGAAIAGLSAASGDATLVLLGNKIGTKRVMIILTIVAAASIAGGYIIDWLF